MAWTSSAGFIGDGPDRAALERQIAEADLSDRVELLGQRPRDEVIELLGSSDVLVAPSVPTRGGKREGIPVVLMEAMSAGLPVVASALSGIPELVADGVTGLIVPPGDPAAIAGRTAPPGGRPGPADPARRRRPTAGWWPTSTSTGARLG